MGSDWKLDFLELELLRLEREKTQAVAELEDLARHARSEKQRAIWQEGLMRARQDVTDRQQAILDGLAKLNARAG